ncbi:winged helix-turn-helix domain-containing protein [Patescibacteria group bacterium]
MANLKDFMISRVRVKLLKLFYENPHELYYVRQLTRKTQEEINAVRRELNRLDRIGVLKSERRGNRLYYYLNPSYDFYEDLLSLVSKTTGLGGAIRKNRVKLGKIKFAMLSGKFVRKKERGKNEVDLLMVGEVVIPELASIVKNEEEKRSTEVNYTVMKQDEFLFRKERRDPFLLGILSKSRVMIIGDEEGLVD